MLIILKVLWHSPENDSAGNTQDIYPAYPGKLLIKNYRRISQWPMNSVNVWWILPLISVMTQIYKLTYRKTSNIRRILVGTKIADHSDEGGASLVGAAPTTSFSTRHMASMDWANTAARRDEQHLCFGIGCVLYQRTDGTHQGLKLYLGSHCTHAVNVRVLHKVLTRRTQPWDSKRYNLGTYDIT